MGFARDGNRMNGKKIQSIVASQPQTGVDSSAMSESYVFSSASYFSKYMTGGLFLSGETVFNGFFPLSRLKP
jgi:hypothetical protein